MNPAELEALFQVIESFLDGSNWRSLHPRPCTQDSLKGMLCEQGNDKLMHVTRLQFGGGISPRCKLSATIPTAISQLPYLRTLLISDCIMSQRTTIPAELGNLANSLQELSLRSNKALVGTIPPALGRLKDLQVLGLSQNNLEGSIPGALGSLRMLQHLDLSYNILSGQIPPVLGGLTGLSIMDLSGNSLEGTIPSSFKGLKALQKLDLSANQLKGKIPSELGNLANLQFLALSQNGFTGPLPVSFARLSNLEYFLMDSNPVHGNLPSYIAGWTQLRELSIANSYYTGAIPNNLGSLFNVSVINLSNNKLEGTIPPTLEQMHQINYLNLSENFLTGSIPFSAHFIQKLGNRLDVHGNPGLCVSASAVSFSGELVAQLRTCDNRGLNNQPASVPNSASPHILTKLSNYAKVTRDLALACSLLFQFFE